MSYSFNVKQAHIQYDMSLQNAVWDTSPALTDLAGAIGTFKWMPKCFNILLLSQTCVTTLAWGGDEIELELAIKPQAWLKDDGIVLQKNGELLKSSTSHSQTRTARVMPPLRTCVCVCVCVCVCLTPVRTKYAWVSEFCWAGSQYDWQHREVF